MELDELLEAKTKELKGLQERKVQSLNEEIRYLETQLQGVRGQYNELKDTFEYNLGLLGERDKELGSYDKIITQLNEERSGHMAEMSDIKVKLADMNQQLLEECAKKEETQRIFQTKIKEVEEGLEREHAIKEQKVSTELAETARVKQHLQIELSDLHEENERRRREWERNFEEEISSLSREHSSKLAACQTKVFQCEGKMKQMTSEREALRLRVSELEETVTAQDAHISQMEEAVEHAEWDVNNFVNLQQARITELDNELGKQKLLLEEREQTLSNKLLVAETHLAEKEEAIKRMKQNQVEERRRRDVEHSSVVRQFEETKLTAKCEAARYEDKLVEASDNIDSLQSATEELRIRLETEEEKCAQQEVKLKLHEQGEEARMREMRTELEMKKQDIARYKTELAMSVKREEALRSEAEQDAQLLRMKCERAESKAYGSQEGLVRDLTDARDKALADMKRMKIDMSLKEDEVRILRGAQNKTGTQHYGEDSNVEVDVLKEQNERLRQVIKQMSSDMEQIASQNRSMQIAESRSAESRDVSCDAGLDPRDAGLDPRDAGLDPRDAGLDPRDAGLDPRDEEGSSALREEVMYLRKMITTQKNKELAASRDNEEFVECRARLQLVGKERDRLLELSNSLRAQLNQVQEQSKTGGVPLQEITSRLNTARSILSSNYIGAARKKTSSSSQMSLLHMSGDTSLNEELSDICRLVESEENRPMSAASEVAIKGRQVSPARRPAIPAPKLVMGANKRPTRGLPNKRKIMNYNQK